MNAEATPPNDRDLHDRADKRHARMHYVDELNLLYVYAEQVSALATIAAIAFAADHKLGIEKEFVARGLKTLVSDAINSLEGSLYWATLGVSETAGIPKSDLVMLKRYEEERQRQ